MTRPPTSRRQRRIGDLLRAEMSRLLLRDLKDRRIATMTTVTEVAVSSDFRHATVYVSVLADDKERKATLIALGHATGHIQAELGKVLQLRFTPQLKFALDDRIAEGDRVLGLMGELQRARDPQPPAADSAPEEQGPDAG